VRAVVSKRGIDDGNQKGGSSFQPAQKSRFYYMKEYSLINLFFLEARGGLRTSVILASQIKEKTLFRRLKASTM